MTHRRPPPPGVEDADAFDEACAVFGPAQAEARLQVFRTELAEQIARVEQGGADPEVLRGIAHRTVGRAGTLGFPTLAEASARLDEAMRANAGVAAALEGWMHAARRVVGVPA